MAIVLLWKSAERERVDGSARPRRRKQDAGLKPRRYESKKRKKHTLRVPGMTKRVERGFATAGYEDLGAFFPDEAGLFLAQRLMAFFLELSWRCLSALPESRRR